jgi:glycosyltransferase involved in cell wall biosynthesis
MTYPIYLFHETLGLTFIAIVSQQTSLMISAVYFIGLLVTVGYGYLVVMVFEPRVASLFRSKKMQSNRPARNLKQVENSLILYWGRRGGGARLYLNIALASEDKETNFLWSFSRKNEEYGQIILKIPEHKRFIIDGPSSTLGFFNFIRAIKTILNTRKFIRSNNVKRVVVVMASPWDTFLNIVCRDLKVEFWRCIHDSKPHEGDIWPSKRTIRRMVQTSDELIFFSHATMESFNHTDKPKTVVSLFEYSSEPATFDSNVLLFAGRILPYKGIKLLEDAWKLIYDQGLKLRIVGEGKLSSMTLAKIAEIENRWLSSQELTGEIAKCEVLILPYLSASQSGLIPIAMSLSKKIVITPIAGLIEQTENYPNIYISSGFGKEELAQTILDAFNAPLVQYTHEETAGIDVINKFSS